jgi:hypothetical protein
MGAAFATAVTLKFYRNPLMRKLAVITSGLKMEKCFVKTYKQQFLEMVICAMIPIFYQYKKEFAEGFNIFNGNDVANGRRLLQSSSN